METNLKDFFSGDSIEFFIINSLLPLVRFAFLIKECK
jgi:hypothetical protein